MPFKDLKITRFFSGAKRLPGRVIFLFLLISAFISLAAWQAVPRALTERDALFLEKILGDAGLPEAGAAARYEDELRRIKDVQRAVFAASPLYKLIPASHPREPEDLYTMKQGYCFDRARTIDKALRLRHFRTRYASLYSTDKTGSAFRSLLTAGGGDVRSHAVVEVLTARGWLVVDTVNPWISLDKDGQPLGLAALEAMAARGNHAAMADEGGAYFLYMKPFTFVYGLYSRHGRFYPPYTPFPDVNWQEILENF